MIQRIPMTKVMSVSQVRADIYNVMDETAQTHEPVLITGKRNNVVMVSQEDWNAIEETLYLNSIPDMVSSIQESREKSDSEFSESVEW
ncbi:MAG: antitoxin YefM [Arcobacteraceae bacterium]|jgi:antitoxin YefM